MTITMTEYPTDHDWMECKRRALKTAGLKVRTPPTLQWKQDILSARHSPIRRLRFSFDLDGIPYWVAMHLRTHVHDCPNGDEFVPYVKSQRDDRQSEYARGKAPQDMPVNMILDMSAEQLMNLCNKRLCMLTAAETRQVVEEMRNLAVAQCPEFTHHLIPMCEYHGGVCHEMKPCGKCVKG